MDRRRYLRFLAAAGAVPLAGCMDDAGNGGGNGNGEGNGNGSGDDTPTDEPSPTPTDGDAPTATETADPTPTPPTDPDQRVEVVNFEFAPASFEISVGDTVLWEWGDAGHNIAYDEGEVPDGTDWEGDDADLYGAGHTHWHTFRTAGTYDYYCQPHRTTGMRASFTVTE